MKKVRITVAKGSQGKKFHVFNSPEALYVWMHDPELQAATRLDATLGTSVFLRPGETMEIEWMGCEFLKEAGRLIRFDQIRLAKSMKVASFDVSKIVGVHRGWVTEDIVSFKSGGDDDVKRTKLTARSKHKFDIDDLFAARGLIEDTDNFVEEKDLH